MPALPVLELATWGESMAMFRASGMRPLRHQSTLELGFGGSESNLAIGLARLGHRVRWIGALGADSLGDLISTQLTAEGVDSRITRDHSRPTGLAIKEMRRAHEQHVHYYRRGSAASAAALSTEQMGELSEASVVHLTGITPALGDAPRRAMQSAIEHARGAGCRISFDVNYRSRLWSSDEARPVLRQLASGSDILFVSWDEIPVLLDNAADLRPEPNSPGLDEALSRLSGMGASTIVVKLGAGGAVTLKDGTVSYCPAAPTVVIDEVGAGDAFAAGYLSGVLDGLEPGQSLSLATTCASLVLRTQGDWEGAPTREELAMATSGPSFLHR